MAPKMFGITEGFRDKIIDHFMENFPMRVSEPFVSVLRNLPVIDIVPRPDTQDVNPVVQTETPPAVAEQEQAVV